MTEPRFHSILLIAWLVLSAAIFVYLLLRPAPYGRHARPGIRPQPSRATRMDHHGTSRGARSRYSIFVGTHRTAAIAFLFLWEFHYFYRTFVFPLNLHPSARPVPIAIVASGFIFNIVNG